MTENRVHAPEIPDTLQWFNVEQPLTLAALRGRVVVLDFWTACCINCQHVVHDLRYLEHKYADQLAVISVHSPKFPHERDPDQLQKAINRHHIRHPVVHDPELLLWQAYTIKAWPSVAVIDPQGHLVGVSRGEGRREQLDGVIAEQLDGHAATAGAQPFTTRAMPESHAALHFPGKLLATEHQLYIADSGRNRLLECYHDGSVRRTFGSGSAGFLDGPGTDAAFDGPQGMAVVGDYLYVADTGNHAIRRIQIRSGDVETVAGTGEQGLHVGTASTNPGQAALNSPWDLAYADGVLYIAMAGQHQIWQYQLARQTLKVLAGSGREGLENGPLEKASLAQPSGLALGRGNLFFADAESSAIRVVRLTRGDIKTLVGKGLFEFGDRDGRARDALMQHPVGVCLDDHRSSLWVADTYNGKIKQIDLTCNAVSTLKISQTLNEPSGVSVHGDTLFIADTNAHRVVKVDLKTSAAEVLEINEQDAV